jgi:LSD1 subclass zinc finger protein
MDETPAQPAAASPEPPAPTPPADDQPVIHRVCEACNNMFATHPGSKHLRCPKCTKE